METEDRELAAFLAGFECSGEGYNAEHGPGEEWIVAHFHNWRDGAPMPDRCSAEPGPPQRVRCRRPSGHEGPHRAYSVAWE